MLVRKVRRVRLHSGWFFIMQKLRTAGNVGKIGNNVISQLLMNLSTGGGGGVMLVRNVRRVRLQFV